jgi:hypothetical protein
MLDRTTGAVALVGLLCACLMTAMGCGGGGSGEHAAEKMLEKAIGHAGGGDADVDFAKGKVRIKGESGETEISFEETGWPDDLPQGVPAFAMAQVAGVSRSEQEGKKVWNVILEEIREGAFQQYAERLESNGWTVANNITTDEGGILQASKGDLVIFGMYNKVEAKGTIGVSMR